MITIYYPSFSFGVSNTEVLADVRVDEDRIENGIHVRTGLKEAAGLMTVVNNCTNCHSSKLVIQNRMTEERWNETIKWMQKKQGLWELGDDQKITMYPFNVFETNYRHECDLRYFMNHQRKGVDAERELIDPKELDRNHIRSHKFLCKNANPREHRIYIMSEIYRRGWQDQTIHSFLNRYFTPDSIGNLDSYITEAQQHYRDEIDQYSQKWLKTKTPIILDYDANNIGDDMNQRMLVKEHFTETYFSFVTETVFDSNPAAPLFITEKTYMPFVNYHPFIITSGPGCLSYLREQGYETFPELFDESYDSFSLLGDTQ